MKKSNKRYPGKLAWLLLILAGLSGLAYLLLADQSLVLYEDAAAAEKPLRLHVLANSDSPADQQLKLAMRDYIIGSLEETLAQAENKQEALAAVEAALPELTTACNSFLKGRADYTASLSLSQEAFPEIDYDGVIMAAGDYDALRIVLGQGAGHNWWCVLFPPLCFVDLAGKYEQEEAIAVLSQYGESPEQANSVRIAWKFKELWQ